MDFLNVLLGILLIVLGVYLVRLTEEIKINIKKERMNNPEAELRGIHLTKQT